MNLLIVKNHNFERVNEIQLEDYSDIFNENKIGKFEGECSIRIRDNVIPTIMPSRRVPIKLREEVQKELDSMVDKDIIERVNEPAEWVSQLVIATKPSGKLRICLDPREINKIILRERFQLRVLDELLYELAQSKVFSKQ